MIKTSNKVTVPSQDNRNIVERFVFAKITKTEILNDSYVIIISEFVEEEHELEDGETYKTKRELCKVRRPKTKEEIRGLIALFQNEEKLTALGLQAYAGVYDTLDQVSQNDFLLSAGHLLENNQKQIRKTSWEMVD